MFDHMDRKDYFKSLVDNELDKFIMEHAEEDNESLLKMCITFMSNRCDPNVARRV